MGLEYLQKFNNLPADIKNKVNSLATVAAISELEKKYGVSLAVLVMKIMTEEVPFQDLTSYLIKEFNLDAVKAGELVKELKEKVFQDVLEYLGGAEKEKITPAVAGPKIEASPRKEAPILKEEISPLTQESPKVFNRPWLAQGGSIRSSDFFFSPEDEEEIKELVKKAGEPKDEKATLVNTERKLNKILEEVGINFGSEVLADRFKNILKTYLSGIRDRIETKETLKKSMEQGGLGFDLDSAEDVLTVADSHLKEEGRTQMPVPPKKIKVPEDNNLVSKPKEINGQKDKITSLKDIGVRDFDYDFSRFTKKESVTLDTTHELPSPEETAKENAQLAAKKEIKIEEKTPSFRRAELQSPRKIEEPEPTEPSKISFRPSTPPQGKVKVEDVKFVPKTMGPVEELKFMDLTNFRRLSKDPLAATRKIEGKIKLLEEERYIKRIEGIRAWRLSPVNKLYLNMGAESISQGKPINVIIEERKNKGEPCLESAEFEAIMDLNKELRF